MIFPSVIVYRNIGRNDIGFWDIVSQEIVIMQRMEIMGIWKRSEIW
jgi:hypothetical protein